MYGYALQNPGRYADPRGECVGPAAIACAAVGGAIGSAVAGFFIDKYFGDDCYTLDELASDLTLGAMFGGLGKAWGLAGAGWRAGAGAGGISKAGGAAGAGMQSNPIVSATGASVGGYTKHGVNRAAGDGFKRAGTKLSSIRDTLKNPHKVRTGVDSQGRPFQTFFGSTAKVTINPSTGKIVSTNPLGGKGVRGGLQ